MVHWFAPEKVTLKFDPRTTGNSDVVDAGVFGVWLVQARAALRGDGGTNVPCGDCVGCCVSSYFIPIRLQDTEARANIPAKLLVVAPGQPSGHAMMGYLEDGTCPMLKEGKCSIYRARPQTCRDYDCRIFTAAGIDAGGADKTAINRRVHQWRFVYEGDADLAAHDAVRAAAHFIQTKREAFPGGRAPTAPTGIAVLAVKTYALFLTHNRCSRTDEEMALAIIDASGKFDAGIDIE
jgi:uncharacterized protein